MYLFIFAQVSLVRAESLENNLSGIHSNLINSLAIFTDAFLPFFLNVFHDRTNQGISTNS